MKRILRIVSIGGCVTGSFIACLFVGILILCQFSPMLNFWITSTFYSSDKQEIESRYNQFCLSAAKEDFETAYTFMSPKYRQMHDLQEFRDHFDIFRLTGDYTYACPLRGIYALSIEGNEATLYPFDDVLWNGPVFHLVRAQGDWYFNELSWSVD